MRIAPSRRLYKAMSAVTDENEYFERMETREQYLREMTSSMDGNFGTTILAALEQLEMSAYSTLYKSSMKSRVAQAKAEIKTVQYMKGIFIGFRTEKQNIEAMKDIIREDLEG